MKKIMLLIVLSIFSFTIQAQTTSTKGGWKQTAYEFVDGTKTVDRVLAGTSDYMEDITKYEGSKGDIIIHFNRYDKSSGKLLAGVDYNVQWTNPESEIFPGDFIRIKYTLKTISSMTWTPDQQFIYFNQGYNGIYMTNDLGEKYLKKDFSGVLSGKIAVDKGVKAGQERTITMNMGAGFKAIYTYVWDPELVKTRVQEDIKEENSLAEGKTGWYFTRWEYIVSVSDGSKSGHFNNGDPYSEVNSAKGDKNNFTTTVTRLDKKGNTIASGKAVTIWTDPPKYFSDTELPSIEVDRTVESSWGINQFSISFDLKDTNPGGGSFGKINFATPDAKTFVQEFKGTMKAPKIIKGNKHGDEKAIIFHFNGYGFKYYYEWRVY